MQAIKSIWNTRSTRLSNQMPWSDNSSSNVPANNECSKPFQVTTGVLQGDTLSVLFVIVLDYALQRIPQHFGLVMHEEPRITIPDLDSVNDIALLDGDYDSARDHLIALKQQVSNVGLLSQILTRPSSWHFQLRCKN